MPLVLASNDYNYHADAVHLERSRHQLGNHCIPTSPDVSWTSRHQLAPLGTPQAGTFALVNCNRSAGPGNIVGLRSLS